MTKSPRSRSASHQHHLAAADQFEALQIGRARNCAEGLGRGATLTEAAARGPRRRLLDRWRADVARLLKALQGLQAQAAAVPERQDLRLTPGGARRLVSCIDRGCSNRRHRPSSSSHQRGDRGNAISQRLRTRPASPPAWSWPSSPSPKRSSNCKPKDGSNEGRGRMVVLCYMHAACASVVSMDG